VIVHGDEEGVAADEAVELDTAGLLSLLDLEGVMVGRTWY